MAYINGKEILFSPEVEVTIEGVEPTLIEKEITANGTYNATDDGADGYSSVVVDVPSIIEVDELPTENIDTNAVYKVKVIPYKNGVIKAGNYTFKDIIDSAIVDVTTESKYQEWQNDGFYYDFYYVVDGEQHYSLECTYVNGTYDGEYYDQIYILTDSGDYYGNGEWFLDKKFTVPYDQEAEAALGDWLNNSAQYIPTFYCFIDGKWEQFKFVDENSIVGTWVLNEEITTYTDEYNGVNPTLHNCDFVYYDSLGSLQRATQFAVVSFNGTFGTITYNDYIDFRIYSYFNEETLVVYENGVRNNRVYNHEWYDFNPNRIIFVLNDGSEIFQTWLRANATKQ